MCLVIAHGSSNFALCATDTLWRVRYADGRQVDKTPGGKLAALSLGWGAVRGCGHLGRAGLQVLRAAPAGLSLDELGARVRAVREERGPEILARYPDSPLDETAWLAIYVTDRGFVAVKFDAEGRATPGNTLLAAPPAGLQANPEPDQLLHDAIARRFLPGWRAARTVGEKVRAVAAAFVWTAQRTAGLSSELDCGLLTRTRDGNVGSVHLLAPAAEAAEATDEELEALFEPGRHLRVA